ncbi:MAG: phosphodiesterase [Fuerstiella sp.]
MTKLRILQLTDLHVFAEPNTRLKGIPTRECLQDVVAWVQQQQAEFDHVIVTGDHTHDERPESYAAVQQILAPWADRLWQIPGNHDDRAVLRSVFGERIAGAADARVNFSFRSGDWLFLGLDSHLPGQVPGAIGPEQMEWLTAQLAAADKPCVALFVHHPPMNVGSEWMDAIGLQDRTRLQQVIRDTPKIRFVCCGHVHHEFTGAIGQTQVFSTPATGLQFDPAGAVPNFATAAPGCRVVEIDGPQFSTYVVRLPEIRYTPNNE